MPRPASSVSRTRAGRAATVLVGAAVTAALLAAGSPATADPAAAEAAAAIAALPSCASLAGSLSTAEQAGQLLMMSIRSSGIRSSETTLLRRHHVGSVLLLGNSKSGVTATAKRTKAVRSRARKPHGVSVMLAADQEGGTVQRLQGPGFTRIPSARTQAKKSNTALRRSATTWARQLDRAGIDANLAPVADVVPTSMEKKNQPIGALSRGYGPKPTTVAAKTSAFVKGMDSGHVATGMKHFPGLGRVIGNPDFSKNVRDSSTTRRDTALQGFRAGVAADMDMLMISSAYYDKIDPKNRAVFSSMVMKKMARDDLGFRGVIISDSLTTPAVADLSYGKRATSFLRAGGDLVIVSDSRAIAPMAEAITARARSDAKFRAEIKTKTARVLTMKARRGLASCG